MITIKELFIDDYEKVIEGIDEESKLHCFIAIHNTTLGPALGGTRIFPYFNREEALKDVLLLAKAMTKKSALARVGLGGGKSVIIADPLQDKNDRLLHAFASLVNTLQGKYIAAEDVGSSVKDMAIIKQTTPYVAALATNISSGDPSPFTAWGVFQSIKATAEKLWGSIDLRGKSVAIQGLGHVGRKLAEYLFWHGADLYLSDINPERLQGLNQLFSATIIHPKEIHSIPCDIFAPCAMGGIINQKIIGSLRCQAVVGAANNQLETPQDGIDLFTRGIVYAPDFIVNSGGVINASMEFAPNGYDSKLARIKVDQIYETLSFVYKKSDKEKKPPVEIADELAEYNLKNKVDAREIPICFR